MDRARALCWALRRSEQPGARHWEDAHGRQQDRPPAEQQGSRREPARLVAQRDLDGQRDHGGEHDRADQATHRPGVRGHATIVRGDRGENRFWEIGAALPMAKHLNVEHEIHPQDREQESAARGEDGSHGVTRPPSPAPRSTARRRRARHCRACTRAAWAATLPSEQRRAEYRSMCEVVRARLPEGLARTQDVGLGDCLFTIPGCANKSPQRSVPVVVSNK